MSAATALVSIGDTGVLNKEVSHPLAEIWIDRDLSWLDFNDRVLAEAMDRRTPLLERAKFLAIFTSNLDEFVMKRISVLRRGTAAGRANLLARIRERLGDSLRLQADCFRNHIVPELAAHGIQLLKWDDLTESQHDEVSRYFDDEVSPALTPLVFDPSHAFPFLSNLSISLAFLLHDPQKETSSYARVKIPSVLKQWIPVETDLPAGQNVFVPLYDVIRGNIHKLYGGMKLTGTTLFRLTRDAEVEIDDESDEALEDVVREQIRQRRYEPVVRLEFAPGSDPSIREMLRERFKLAPTDVYDLPGELDYTSLFQISALPIAPLRDPAWTPLPPVLLKTATTYLPRYAPATSWSIIHTRALRIVSSTSSQRRHAIQKRLF
jgi:polyphosphate kinase